jgi:uncharacterized phage protein (TIGR01671 family)
MNMSREIKFRVWDKDNNKMLHYDNDIVPCLTLNGVLQDCSKEVSSNVSYKYELMQFTGLLDKNGVEIYEGDIVKNEREEFITGVEYYGGAFRCESEGMPLSLYIDECYGDKELNNQLEVIGNIYDNKELNI